MPKIIKNHPVHIFGFVLIVIAVTSAYYGGVGSNDGLKGFLSNLSTEIIGAILLYIVFERALSHSHDKERFIRQLGSKDNGLAVHAFHELVNLGAVHNGSLADCYLHGANLAGIKSFQAVFNNAELVGASFTKADIRSTDFRRADLSETDFSGATLDWSDFRGARLWEANLEGALFYDADLRGADLFGANLKNAEFDRAQFDEHTILPDGKKWRSGVDLRDFRAPRQISTVKTNLYRSR